MAIKILVVDDSATMRKILEMTFAGEDAQVVTADNAPAALAKAGDFRPNVILADTSMKPDGYELAQALRGQATLAGTPLIVLASQQNPYDAARGASSGVDDHIVKPFDTQALIDKVKTVVARGRAGAPAPQPTAAAPAPVPAPAAPRPPAPPAAPAAAAAASPPRDLKRTMAFGTPLAPIANPVGPVQRTTESSTVGPLPAAPPPPAPKPMLELDDEPIELRPAAPKPAAAPVPPPRPPAPAPVAAPAAPPPPVAAPRPPAPVAAPAPVAVAAPVASPAPTPSPAPAAPSPAPAAKVAAATSQNGALAGKLAGLGLDASQVAGVLALSREVIEQVVWEVVPDLAETIIREEIKRLTAD